jgi:antitoxin HicB
LIDGIIGEWNDKAGLSGCDRTSRREDGGGFVATVPDLPGCMSDGETPEAALANVRDAVAAWIEEAQALGRIVPEPSRCHVAAE